MMTYAFLFQIAMNTPSAIPDRSGVNIFDDDAEMQSLLRLYLPADLHSHLLPYFKALGAGAGGPLDALAQSADKNPPTLTHRTRTGENEQKIVKHPDYLALEKIAFADYGLAAMSHRAGVLGWPQVLPPVAKYALTYLFVQAEFGLCCPVSMTDSLARTLRKFGDPALVARYLPGLNSQDMGLLTQGAMFMTEQGAGSDVAATATLAQPDELLCRPDTPDAPKAWRLTGDKWFCSNPDAGLAMVLARTGDAALGIRGVSLFLLPRRLPDGSANALRIVRLKDKLGTKSMASGEIELNGAVAYLVGEEGRGFVQMADMVNNSRLSNGVRAAGLMRRAASEALFIAQNRQAFGKKLIDLPLMRRQLTKLMLPAEQARTMVFQTSEALRRADEGDAKAYALVRILTPLIKFRACRDARKVTGDAMEVRGGCGYIEEWSDARLVRDSHLGSIWEGTSNIVALDVLRAIQREDALTVLMTYLGGLAEQIEEPHGLKTRLAQVKPRVVQLAQAALANEALARRAASALYHFTSAVAMAWEATQTGSEFRMNVAVLVLKHRLQSPDPLSVDLSGGLNGGLKSDLGDSEALEGLFT